MATKVLTREELHKKRINAISEHNFGLCVDAIIKAACSCNKYVGITKCPGCHGSRFFGILGKLGLWRVVKVLFVSFISQCSVR